MATLAATHPTLLDFKARLDPNDKVAQVVEMLHQTNEIIEVVRSGVCGISRADKSLRP